MDKYQNDLLEAEYFHKWREKDFDNVSKKESHARNLILKEERL